MRHVRDGGRAGATGTAGVEERGPHAGEDTLSNRRPGVGANCRLGLAEQQRRGNLVPPAEQVRCRRLKQHQVRALRHEPLEIRQRRGGAPQRRPSADRAVPRRSRRGVLQQIAIAAFEFEPDVDLAMLRGGTSSHPTLLDAQRPSPAGDGVEPAAGDERLEEREPKERLGASARQGLVDGLQQELDCGGVSRCV